MHINEALILGRGEQLSGGSLRRSILADSVESVIGAVYLDGGFDAARQVVARVLDNIDPDDWRDFKTELQEYTQGQGHGAPEYEIIAQSGPAHARVFTAVVFVEGKQLGSGEGNTKKNAQQAAARAAIGMLGCRIFSPDLSMVARYPVFWYNTENRRFWLRTALFCVR